MDITVGALRRAFEHVNANHGCAGVDGITLARYRADLDLNLRALQDRLLRKAYAPLPLMKVFVPKKSDGQRTLCIPCVVDRIAQTAVLHRIEPVLDREFESCSFAYRKGRSIRQAVMRIKACRDAGYRWVVDADIDDFFGTVDHDLLMVKCREHLTDPDILHLIGLWLKTEVWDGRQLTVLDTGLPQGSAISPILANLFLDELDEKMEAMGFRYVRYADDYLILGKKEEDARQGLDASKHILRELSLELDEEEITTFEKGFKYLGVVFLNNLIMEPYEKGGKGRKGAVFPAPLNMEAYFTLKNGAAYHGDPLHHGAALHPAEDRREADPPEG
ncbi:reverse transcriptase domain-containing protein [Desulfoluna butyratoxydans]|uniref:RNA-directed DNA polymerase n=1 Tax=Desulfoluna butyratoxydans TaxID=231438 RepID=A0A4U8YIT4_9BACT|nr:reverse transcriptase domain-containing protein [Desulfoluna butyratoxydans]VFQ43164.1 reverse transcriptase domain [Desulfoluna butyratoxydans]